VNRPPQSEARSTDGSENVVTRAHDCANVGFSELVDNTGGNVLELVLKDDEASKFQSGLCFLSLHLLNLEPVEFENVLGSTSNDTETSVSVVCEQLIIVWREALGTTDVLHRLGSTFDIDISTFLAKLPDDNTCAAQL
jgi:hypothetical protein